MIASISKEITNEQNLQINHQSNAEAPEPQLNCHNQQGNNTRGQHRAPNKFYWSTKQADLK